MAKQATYKRFVRNPNPKPFRLQTRDIEILTLLAEYRFLTTYQILALQPRGIRNLRRRLQYMFHAGLVDRPTKQHDFLKPPGPMVYALGNKGADVLAETLEVDRGKVNWQTKNREVGLHYIDHTLMVSNFRATLTLALKPLQEANLISWGQGPELKVTALVDGQRVAIVPDGFFTVQGKGPLHYFLEADRSTMTSKRFLRKMRAYWRWWKDGGHQNKFGISRFRVLTLTISEKRKENLRKLATRADDRQQGSPMFLFACEKNFRLEQPEAILQAIWQTPVDDKWHSILAN